MNLNEYQKWADTKSGAYGKGESLLRFQGAVIGLAEEACEVLGVVFGDYSPHKVKDELGDLHWYVGEVCNSRGWELETLYRDRCLGDSLLCSREEKLRVASQIAIIGGQILGFEKKIFYHGHSVPCLEFWEKITSLLYFSDMLANMYGFDLDDILSHNVEKLNARYDSGFTSEESINRGEG
jgi:NTP pyrophosphatase (non-canonical NTP hydrolase)